jgi:hypothetical protein
MLVEEPSDSFEARVTVDAYLRLLGPFGRE